MIASASIVLMAGLVGQSCANPSVPDLGESLFQKVRLPFRSSQFAPLETFSTLGDFGENDPLNVDSSSGVPGSLHQNDDCHVVPAQHDSKGARGPVGMRSAATRVNNLVPLQNAFKGAREPEGIRSAEAKVYLEPFSMIDFIAVLEAKVDHVKIVMGDSPFFLYFLEFIVFFALVAGYDNLRCWMKSGDGYAKIASGFEEKHNPAEPTDVWGCTALHKAAASAATTDLKTLLVSGARVHARDAWNETPLHFAARAGNAASCELLIAWGADVNAVNMDDRTPLILAADERKSEACDVLLGHGGHAGGAADSEIPPMLSTLLMLRMLA